MANALTRLLIIGILEALYQVTVTRVLTMRSRFAYHAIKTADFFVTMTLRNLNMFPTASMVGAIVLFDLALPVMLSSGSYSRRILRATFVEFDSVIGDLLGTTLFVTVFGGSTADLQQLGQGMTPKAATVYLLVALISALLFELTIAVCNHSDKTNDQISSLPTILLIPSAVVLFIVTYVRFVGDGMRHIPSYVCAWISLGGVYLISLGCDGFLPVICAVLYYLYLLHCCGGSYICGSVVEIFRIEIVLLVDGSIKKTGSVSEVMPELIGTTAAVNACEKLK